MLARSALLIVASLTLASLAALPAVPGAAFAPSTQYTLQYDIRADGTIDYRVFGTYLYGIRCGAVWDVTDMIHVPGINIGTSATSASTSPVVKTIAFQVDLVYSTLRVVETYGTVRSVDKMFQCPSPTLFSIDGAGIPGPNAPIKAPPTLSGCQSLEWEAWATAESDANPKPAEFQGKGHHAGVCLKFNWTGPQAGIGCKTTNGQCVPFSGNIGASVLDKKANHQTWVEGTACSSIILGGVCWGSTPVVAESSYHACECPLEHRGFPAANDVMGSASLNVGTWAYTFWST